MPKSLKKPYPIWLRVARIAQAEALASESESGVQSFSVAP